MEYLSDLYVEHALALHEQDQSLADCIEAEITIVVNRMHEGTLPTALQAA